MDLIVFAHRAEAKSFLREGRFEAISEAKRLSLYRGQLPSGHESKDCLILVAGEGAQQATAHLSQALGFLTDHPLTRILNYGVCGALDHQHSVGQLYPIRTVYREGRPDHHMEFKSFQLQEAGSDLVTTHQRILSDQHHSFLSHFAPLVDREAWAFAYSAKLAGIPFLSFKIISDRAGKEEGHSSQLCQIVKEQAPLWSEQMLEHYLSLAAPDRPPLNSSSQLLDPHYFHVTKAQDHILDKLFHALKLKGLTPRQACTEAKIEHIKQKKGQKKERTKTLIERLTILLNPLHHALEQQLAELTREMKSQNINVSFDPSFEEQKVNLSVTVRDQAHMKQVIQALDHFDYHQLDVILSGQGLDV